MLQVVVAGQPAGPMQPFDALTVVFVHKDGTPTSADRYNHRRLHGESGHVPPTDFETNY